MRKVILKKKTRLIVETPIEEAVDTSSFDEISLDALSLVFESRYNALVNPLLAMLAGELAANTAFDNVKSVIIKTLGEDTDFDQSNFNKHLEKSVERALQYLLQRFALENVVAKEDLHSATMLLLADKENPPAAPTPAVKRQLDEMRDNLKTLSDVAVLAKNSVAPRDESPYGMTRPDRKESRKPNKAPTDP